MIVREEKMEKNEMKKLEKENIVRKIYPTCRNWPGGTQKLVNEKPADITSTVSRRVGKLVTARSFDNPYANLIKNQNILTNDTNTVMHFMNKETNHRQTTSGLPGGTDEIFFTLERTNHRRGRELRESLTNDWFCCLIISWGWSGFFEKSVPEIWECTRNIGQP